MSLEITSQVLDGANLKTINWKNVGIAAGSGAVSGAFAATNYRVSYQIAMGATVAAGDYLADCAVNNTKVTAKNFAYAVAGGAAAGAIGGDGASGRVLQNNWNVAGKSIAKETRRASYKYSAKAIARNQNVKKDIGKKVIKASRKYTTGGVFATFLQKGVNMVKSMVKGITNAIKKLF